MSVWFVVHALVAGFLFGWSASLRGDERVAVFVAGAANAVIGMALFWAGQR